jgi:Tol biopolymer transport system component
MSFSLPVAGADASRLFVVGSQRRAELLKYDSKSAQFVPFTPQISAGHVDFSSNGTRITYVAYPEGTVWRSNIDGTDKLQLTMQSRDSTDSMPRWSPDGKLIAFARISGDGHMTMFRVSADGGDAEALLPEHNDNEDDPNWSPDGKKVVFAVAPHSASADAGQWSLRILDLETRTVSTLPNSNGLLGPRWSPSGQYICALSFISPGHLLVFDLKQNAWSTVADGRFGYPSWSRDEKYIYVERTGIDLPEIDRIEPLTGKVEKVTAIKDIPRAVLPFSQLWSGVTPDGAPLIMKEVGSQEIYSLEWKRP